MAEPQNPPFEFPEKFEQEGQCYVKDDYGPIIGMGYRGPTPGGLPSKRVWIVNHDNPTSVHSRENYIYQMYCLTNTEGAK